MSIKFITGALLVGAFLFTANSAVFAQSTNSKITDKQSQTQKSKDSHKSWSKSKPDLTEQQAQAIALKKFPGTVEKSRTETVKGSQVYFFNIEGKKGFERNVWVNMSGKIIKSEKAK